MWQRFLARAIIKSMEKTNAIRDAVFGKQQILARVYHDFGHLALSDYVKSWKVAQPAGSELRDSFFLQAELFCSELYGSKIAGDVLSQLKERSLVSTIDHHGIFGHPFFLNSNLICSLNPSRYLVSLPTEGVSLNNNTSWSGCLLTTGGDGRLNRYSFFPDRLKTSAVFAVPAIGKEDIEKVLHQIKNSNNFNQENLAMLEATVLKNFSQDKLLSADNFSVQAAMISRKIWQEVFPNAAELIYLPLETLVNRIIVNHIVLKPQSLLHKLLFTKTGWDLVEKYFQGSPGAFSDSGKGSFLFWGIDKKHRRIRLVREKKALLGGHLEIFCESGSIAAAIQKKEIYPTSLVCFLVLLGAGVTCVGGFNQVNWLTGIKMKFRELLLEIGEVEISTSIASVPTENFGEASLAFLVGTELFQKPAALDLLGKNFIYEIYSQLAEQLTLKESIDAELGEIYKVIMTGEQRDENLLRNFERQNSLSSQTKEKILNLFRKD